MQVEFSVTPEREEEPRGFLASLEWRKELDFPNSPQSEKQQQEYESRCVEETQKALASPEEGEPSVTTEEEPGDVHPLPDRKKIRKISPI